MAKNLQLANENTMRHQHKKSKYRPFKIGDRLFRKSHKRIPGVTSSQLARFEGPMVIVQKDRDNYVNVRLADLHSGQVDKHLTHVNELKLVTDGRDLLEKKYRTRPNLTSQTHSANAAESTRDNQLVQDDSQDDIIRQDTNQLSPSTSVEATAIHQTAHRKPLKVSRSRHNTGLAFK